MVGKILHEFAAAASPGEDGVHRLNRYVDVMTAGVAGDVEAVLKLELSVEDVGT
jgi:hypothetical protein